MRTEKLSQFILQLIKLTKNNEVEWQSYNLVDAELPNGDMVIDKVYEADVNGKRFRLYRYKYKYWRDEDRFEWTLQIRLELINNSKTVEYEFEYENSLSDLYEIVREQCSKVTELIDEILGLKLTILSAIYGTQNKTMDVTEEVKRKVIQNRLNIIASNEIGGDPEPGFVKTLKIRFNYAGETLEKEFGEGHPVTLPPTTSPTIGF